MKIYRYLVRLYPPAIILEYDKERHGRRLQHTIELNYVNIWSEPRQVVAQILRDHEPWIPATRHSSLLRLVARLISQLRAEPITSYDLGESKGRPSYNNVAQISAHLLSMTTLDISKAGDYVITSSYDRTCKIWDANNGREVTKLTGHEHAVSAVSFNNPYANRVVTGSHDATCAIWDVSSGSQLAILRGHSAEITAVTYAGKSRLCDDQLIVSASRDASARVWDTATGTALLQPFLHDDEVVCVDPSADGRVLLTGSFDRTCRLWDLRTASQHSVRILGQSSANHGNGQSIRDAHQGEITKAILDWDAARAVSSSIDGKAKVWDLRTGKCMITVSGSPDSRQVDLSQSQVAAITDVTLNLRGNLLATASEDGYVCLFSAQTGSLLQSALAHGGQSVTALRFNGSGSLLMSSGEDGKANIWSVTQPDDPRVLASASSAAARQGNRRSSTSDQEPEPDTLKLWQTLGGHNAGLFSAVFSYHADVIATASTDNVCKVWKLGSS